MCGGWCSFCKSKLVTKECCLATDGENLMGIISFCTPWKLIIHVHPTFSAPSFSRPCSACALGLGLCDRLSRVTQFHYPHTHAAAAVIQLRSSSSGFFSFLSHCAVRSGCCSLRNGTQRCPGKDTTDCVISVDGGFTKHTSVSTSTIHPHLCCNSSAISHTYFTRSLTLCVFGFFMLSKSTGLLLFLSLIFLRELIRSQMEKFIL